MFNCTRIKSVEYYEAANRQALADLPKNLRLLIEKHEGIRDESKTDDEVAREIASEFKARFPGKFKTPAEAFEYAYDRTMKVFIPAEGRASETGRNGERRDGAAYYTDNGASEAAGVWWTRKRGQDNQAEGTSLPILSLLPLSNGETQANPFASLVHGATVDGAVLRALAAGRDPVESTVIRNSRNRNSPIRPVSKDGTSKVSVGYDCQFAAPKSVTMLAMAGDAELREGIFADHDAALEFALNFVVDEGLLVTRSGAQGREKEPVSEIAAAKYRHFTSRAGDPQLHTHVVVMNMAKRADGSIGTIDNATMLKYQAAIGAAYRAELARRMQARGFDVVRKKRAFEIAGITDEVVDQFSKRRAQIEKAAQGTVDPETGEIIGAFDVSKDRAKAQQAANETRDAKDKVPDILDLEDRWDRELAGIGMTRETLIESARVEARIMARDRAAAVAAGDVPPTVAERAMKAVETLMGNESVFERRKLYAAVLEEMQGVCGAEEALAAVKALEASGQIIAVGTIGEEPVYSTGAMVELEKNLFRIGLQRQDEREFVSREAIEAVLLRDKFKTVREEQANAVRHALNRDGVAVVEGLAGSGKSFSTEILKEVAEDCGLKVFGIAPSHKARDVLRNDAGLAEEMTAAVAGAVLKLEKGEMVWDRDTVVILDEAGMVGTRDMESLMRHAQQAGAKLILTGDSRQLQPVVAGAPMKTLSKELGAARLDNIVRQTGTTPAEGAWMRAASVELAIGENPALALEAYDRAGCVILNDDREETIDALVADYVAACSMPDFIIHEQKRPITRAVLTGWNADVRKINKDIRAGLKQDGMLGDDVVTIQASPRGGDTPEEMGLAIGDQIIFGEALKDHGIFNSDIAKIDGIDATDPADPVLTFTMNKDGRTITARASQLVGWRDPEAKGPHVPKMQHSYCMSIHASQGCTVDQTWVANIRGMGRESIYVAMTRHRLGVRLYASLDRIYDQIAAKTTGAAAAISKDGVSLPEEGDRHADPTIQQAKAALFAEVADSELKMNAADFVKGGVRKWLGFPSKIEAAAAAGVKLTELAPGIREALAGQSARPAMPKRIVPPTPLKTATQELAERTHAIRATDPALAAQLATQAPQGVRRTFGAMKTTAAGDDAVAVLEPVGAIVTPETVAPVAAVPQAVPAKKGFGSMAKASGDGDGGDQGESAPAPAFVPAPKPEPVEPVQPGFGGMAKGDVSEDQDTDEARPVAPLSVGQQLAAMRQGRAADAPTVSVRQPRQETPKGRVTDEERNKMARTDLIQFATSELGFKAEQVNQGGTQAVLNDGKEKITVTQGRSGAWIWTPTKGGGNAGGAMIWDLVQRIEGKTYGQALHWLRDKLSTWKGDADYRSKIEKARPMGGTAEDREKMHQRFRLSTGGASKYLTEARGLDASMLNRFSADVRQEGIHPTNANKNGAMFAHRNIDFEITGFVRRGYPTLHDDGLMKSFRLHQKGGEPNMMLAGERRNPSRIYVAESAIDTFSRYQMDDQPQRAMLTSTDGQPSDRALAMYSELARRHPDTEWHIGFDNDDERVKPNGERWRPGEDFGNKVRAAILEGNPDADIHDRKCGEEFKDANDELRGITKAASLDNAAKDQAQHDQEKQRIEEERQRQEAERIRLEEEAKKAQQQPPTYKPRGPR